MKILAVFGALFLLMSSAKAHAAAYQLTVEIARVEVNGKTVEKLAINGQIPGPTLHLNEGEDAVITVTNKTNEPTSTHWHGIMLPGMMDGAPGFNGFRGIAPGQSFTHTFHIRQSGTYWYHSHSGTQDQSVLGAIVIDPATPSPIKSDRDYVVLFSDLTQENPDRVLRNLKADPGYYNYSKRTIFDFFRDSKELGFGAAMKDRAAWGQMRMDPTDVADVGGYVFLVNGKNPGRNETFLFSRGERVRLRLINGSAMTFLDVRLPGLKLTVVAADGNDVEPIVVDELRMGIAERYDVIVEPTDEKAYTLFAESLDRTGYARATLATAMGQVAPIPERRPRTLLTMADMGGAHAGHTGSARSSSTSVDHSAHAGQVVPEPAVERLDHGAHGGHVMAETATPVDHSAHAVMDHAGHEVASTAPLGHDAHQAGEPATPTAVDHSAHAGPAANRSSRPLGWAAGFPPGVKVISYSDLRALNANSDTRAPTRDIDVRLTGNMERYMWSLNGEKFADAQPIRARYGERVRLTFANETMMAHPMHLHGMFFEVENGQSNRKPLKDTVIVPPGQRVSIVLTAKEVGAWPLHCHLLYHMASGMMTTFIVEPPGANDNSITPDGSAISMTPHGAHGHH